MQFIECNEYNIFMQLSKNQIDELYEFVRTKGIQLLIYKKNL